MKSSTTPEFWKYYEALPPYVKRRARKAFSRFVNNPYYPSLHFNRIHSTLPIYSVRISRNYRAVGTIQNDEILWHWIGSHAEYDKLVKHLKTRSKDIT